jgi:competence protein ComEC
MAGETASGEVSERHQFASVRGTATPFLPPAQIDAPSPLGPLVASRIANLPLARLVALVPTKASAARAIATALGMELDRGTPFLLVPVLLGFGAIVYYKLPDEPGFQPLLGGMLVLSAFRALVPSQRQGARLALMAMLICLLGMALAKAETWRASTSMLGSEISTRLVGRVAEIDYMANGRIRLTIDVLTTAKPKLRYAPDRVRLSARKIPDGLVVGSEIEGAVRLMPPTGPVRPDSYDFSFISYFDGIGGSGFFLRGPDLVANAPPLTAPMRFFNAVENLRNTIADRIRGHIGGAEGEIAAALVVGIRAGIPEDITEAMRRTGIYHIISISGLHMALVAGTVMGTLRAIFGLFPGFASRYPVKKYAAAAALAAIAGYVFISGGQVAAQRSFFMLAIMLTALLFDRGALTTRNLAISALVIIVVSPHEIVGPSFQMSFAATAALVGAYALWTERRRSKTSVPPNIGRPFWAVMFGKAWGAVGAMMMTSIVAGIATTAFGVYHFQRVSPLSLVANLAVMPSVSILVMPFAVAGSLAMPFGLDAPFFYVVGKGLTIMIVAAQWLSERSPMDGVGLISSQSLILLTIALVIVTMATTWLRALALPFALAGIFTLTNVRMPDVFISEDGRLVGVPIGARQLAVNRARPNAFTVENWKRAMRTEEIIGPVDSIKSRGSGKAQRVVDAPATAVPDEEAFVTEENGFENARESEDAAALKETSGSGFDCHDGLCIAVHVSGAIIAYATSMKAARRACDYASLIVVDDAVANNVCGTGPPLVVTKRQLAKYGSAAVFLSTAETAQAAEVRFALDEPYRPWHTQRQFSREARGLPPYQQKRSASDKKTTQPKWRPAKPSDQ